MHVAIVGSATLTPEQQHQAGRLVALIVTSYRYLVKINDGTGNPMEHVAIISGESPYGGVDAFARQYADQIGMEFKGYPPAHNRWEPHGFKERNEAIAQRCDTLYRVATQNSKTYGSGWTADRTAALGKPVFRFYI